jgi:hypothetical protein
MRVVNTLHLLAAFGSAKSANGGLGLVVVFVLAIALYVLIRSMSKHLRKVDRMKADGVFDTSPIPPHRDPDEKA